MTNLFAWGDAEEGQLSLGNIGDPYVTTPQQVQTLHGWDIKDICCGASHTVILLNNGTVYTCGNNGCSQLGHAKSQKTAERVEALEVLKVTQVSVGDRFNLVLTNSGELYSWGERTEGQLGRGSGDEEKGHSRLPRLLKSLTSVRFVQITCGKHHCLALSDDGRVFSWGHNKHGQLGLGTTEPRDVPHVIPTLLGLPVRQISTGGSHSFVITYSGAVFGWGKNCFGQLGLNDERDRHYPTLCKPLRSQKIKYVSCGEDHTAVLTHDGGVFTFGLGTSGQLGHARLNNEILPKRVLELMGSRVTQVSCGKRHTMAYIPSSGRVYTVGQAGHGQLGLGSTDLKHTPCPVKGPFVSGQSDKKSMEEEDAEPTFVIKQIFTGGNHCFALATHSDNPTSPDNYCDIIREKEISHIDCDLVERIANVALSQKPDADLTNVVDRIFSSSSCFNCSFLVDNDEHYNCSSKNHGVDLQKVRCCFQKLEKCSNIITQHLICGRIEHRLIPELPSSPPDVEALRIYLILPELHYFDLPKNYASLICPFGDAILKLVKPPARILDLWWATYPSTFFGRLIFIFKQAILHILDLPKPQFDREQVVSRERNLRTAMEVLKKLNSVNDTNGQIVPYTKFYIPELIDKIEIQTDYIHWVQQALANKRESQLAFCNYPFLFDGASKSLLLQTDAMLQMRLAIEEVSRHNFASLIMPSTAIDPVNPCLVLYISRQNIVQDTITQLTRQSISDLKKPLKIIFMGEDAIDEGGVRKEFFLLIYREILDPKFGMFHYYEESRLMWFNNQSFEENGMFALIGALCGLAIYNSTIIDLSFPLALYKKLLKRPVGLEDMKQLQPSVGRSLESLLEHESDDIEDVFDLTFEITQENFGELQTIELIPGGSSMRVSKTNRIEYVEAYIEHVFTKSVAAQYSAFGEGFQKVCGGRVLELFQPQELQGMVVGNENYDFTELEKNTEYKGEYVRYHQTIIYFWDVFHDLSLEQKKKFLLYLTGSDKIPILGMKSVKMMIQSVAGGEEFLPVAHTCFNLLDLPKYTSKEKLHEKLVKAIEHAEGFGLV